MRAESQHFLGAMQQVTAGLQQHGTVQQPLSLRFDLTSCSGCENNSAPVRADVLRVMPSKAIELMAFDVFKTVFHRDGERPGPAGTMLSGALAGLCRCASRVACGVA